MIGIGSLLIQPIAEGGVYHTLAVGILITLLMLLTEFLEMKFDKLETISTGKAKIVIENGQLNIKNLKKLRMSVDRLETRLRQSGISSIEDVKHATIEVSGLLGYELYDHKKPMTKEDFDVLMNEITDIKRSMGLTTSNPTKKNDGNNLFTEIKSNKFEGKDEPTS